MDMVFHATQLLLIVLISVTAQFMPPMPYQFMSQPNLSPSIQMPNGLPGPLPDGLPQPILPNMPHMPGVPPPIIMPPLQFPMSGGRLPMVVMPHYNKKKDSKKHKKKKHGHKKIDIRSSESDVSSDTSDEFRTRNHLRSSRKIRREVLTPVVSYVTKDGYVVYQKKIKKEKAKDWLELSQVESNEFENKDRMWKHRYN